MSVVDRTVPLAPMPEEKEGRTAAGAPHALITRTPNAQLTFLQTMGSPLQGCHRGRAAACVHRVSDHRRLHRLPAPPVQARGHPPLRGPRGPAMQGGHETWP